MARVAPQPVGTATTFAAVTAGTTIVLNRPAVTLQNGDMLVAGLRTNATSGATDGWAGNGFSRRGRAFVASDASGREAGIFTHLVTDAASEPSSYTFTSTVSAARRVGVLYVVRGVDPANPIQGQASNFGTAGTTVTINSFTLDAVDEALELFLFATEITSPNATEPTAVPGSAVALVPSSAGTGATRTTVWAGSKVVSGSTTISGDALTWSSATGSWASAVVLRGLEVPLVPLPGFSSVSAMLATPGATWAHRGGSAVTGWPEMSEYAFDHAVAAGYGVLDFSANRTSDGVWLGCHDASLNRTSETTGLPNISAMTWAQVQAYQNSLNAAGTPRPYFRLDVFLDKYTPTHVAVVDPKAAVGTYNTEFLNLLDAHGGPSKIIVKFAGAGTGGGLASAAAARGYQTWGYYYEADIQSGALATYQSAWSILGMECTASQTSWDAVLAYGKPVVGHIAASQVNYNAAFAHGARIVQVSNVTGVTPIGASAIVAAGTITLTGTAARTIGMSRTTDATLTIGGTATATVSMTRDAPGTLAFAGGADRAIGITRTADGELTTGGGGDATIQVFRTAEGIIILDGQGLVVQPETPMVIDNHRRPWPSRAPGAEHPYSLH